IQRMVESALLNHSNRSSRVGTAEHKSRASSVLSDASTIKEIHVGTLDDFTMDAIFNSVTLPSVEFTHQHDEMSALANFDNALANESSQSYCSSVSSLLASPVVSHHHPIVDVIAHKIAEHVIEEAIHEHELHNHHEHEVDNEAILARLKLEQAIMERERERAAELIAEMEDQFEETLNVASRRSSVFTSTVYSHLSHRHRSMTVDSLASLAESRFGGFDVHDDNDQYTAEELDLHHDEVAYQRVKKLKSLSASLPASARGPTDEDVAELEEFHRKLVQARQEIAFLEARIAEHEALRKGRAGSIASNGHRHSYHGHTHHDKWASEVDAIYEEDVGVSPIARHHIENGTEVDRAGGRTIIVPQMHRVESFSTATVHKFIIGGEQEASPEDKTVLLFGPVGSGKSALINSMLNYLYDVKRENRFRFVVNYPPTKTDGINVYVFNNTILPYSVTIVDTPGVSNEKGKGTDHPDKTVSTLIQTWFEKELIANGKFRLDAISVVLRNAESRLEWPFIHELAAIKRMFGDDLKTNVLPIITNTEVLPQPVAVRALASANIAFLQYYKVNNAGFFAQPVNDMTKLKHNLFYRAGIASLETYFKDLQELIHPLVAVLRSRAAHASLGDATIY
ncbi:hypothetical protein PFISCL1PPCAC_27499, partial [Pristionchus fissidentatus]